MLGAILSCAISVSLSGQVVDSDDIHYEPTWESLSQHSTPEWYEDAVLGIYFHWGVYSVAEMGEWYAQHMYLEEGDIYHSGDKEYHTETWGDPCTEFGYKDFVPMFKAEKWDPDYWAELFEYAGADFAGPVAEHCDGFSTCPQVIFNELHVNGKIHSGQNETYSVSSVEFNAIKKSHQSMKREGGI